MFKKILLSLLSMVAFSAHAIPLYSLTPQTSTTLDLPLNSTAQVKYLLTNNTNRPQTIVMEVIQGVTQDVTVQNACANPISVAAKGTCVLALNLSGANVPVSGIKSGPRVCKTVSGSSQPDPFACAQPSVQSQLNVNRVAGAAPTITSITPNYGSTTNTANVTISGTLLADTSSVKFGGVSGTIQSKTDTSVVVTYPNYSSEGQVNVTLTSPYGTAISANGFTYYDSQFIGTVVPNAGSTSGGTSVTLTGTNLSEVNSVSFGGSVANIVSKTDTQLVVTTTGHATGLVDLVLTSNPPFNVYTKPNAFTYGPNPTITSISPNTGSVDGGQTITITGTNLTGTSSVTFGGTAATSVTVVNSTTVTAVTPVKPAGSVNVVLTTPYNSVTSNNGFTYGANPTITTISPNTGSVNGNQTITITGTNLTGTSSVTFGGTAATSVTVSNSTTVTAVTPAKAAGAVDVVLTTPYNTVTSNNGFTYVNNTTLSTSISQLALSVTGLTEYGVTPTTSGVARQITITNTGGTSATNLSITYPTWPTGTTASSTCGASLAAGASCTITVTPGANATSNCNTSHTAPTPGVVAVSSTNVVTSVTTNVVVLGYSCQYQGGYVYAFDDTTTNTGSVGGKVATTFDQADPYPNGVIWSSNGAGRATVNVSYDIIPLISEISSTPTYANAQSTFNSTYANVATFPFPDSSAFSSCSGANDGQCNSNNILALYDTYQTGYGVGISPYTLALGRTNRTYYAAGLCKQTISGYSDWYLPAICEMGYDANIEGSGCGSSNTPTLQNMQKSLIDISGLSVPAGSYWSSTDGSNYQQQSAWNEYFLSGGSYQTYSLKNSQAGVRCSRALTPNPVAPSNVFSSEANPTITSISPNSGGSGALITITGTGFTAGTTVDFVQTSGPTIRAGTSVNVSSPTSLTVTTPSLGSVIGPVDVRVTTPKGNVTLANGYNYTSAESNESQLPRIQSLSPEGGMTKGGNEVLLRGYLLNDVKEVRFGDALAKIVKHDDFSMTVVAPAHVEGKVDVVLHTDAESIVSKNMYHYTNLPVITSIQPNSGSINGHYLTSIKGYNLSLAESVSFDGTKSTVIPTSNPYIINVNVPVGGSVGKVDVGIMDKNSLGTVMNAAFEYLDNSLELSQNHLELSVNHPQLNEALTGQARKIIVKNNGTAPITQVHYKVSPALPSGTTITPEECGDIDVDSYCELTVTPGLEASSKPLEEAMPSILTISGDGTKEVTAEIRVLSYGRIFNGGYIFAIDDSVSEGSVHGKVLALDDRTAQDSPMIWGEEALGHSEECIAHEDGYCNSNAFLELLSKDSANASSFAVGACKEMSGTATWFLPAICELAPLEGVCDIVQSVKTTLVDTGILTALDNNYWSSSVSEDKIWAHLFSAIEDKNSQVEPSAELHVRCASSF
jgi:hypothetical protein